MMGDPPTRGPVLLLLALLLLPPERAHAQASAGTDANIEPRMLIDVPTAGMLPGSSFALGFDFFQEGGMLVGMSFGVIDRLTIGLSYGGTGLIGSGEVTMNKLPGVQLRVRIIEESPALPALVLGFDSQGKDGYLEDLDRYRIKSPGFFASLSRNYSWLGNFGFHAGMNYSLERGDGDRDLNFYAGADKSIGDVVSLVAEYNLASNDSDGEAIGKGRGYLNLGFRWSPGTGITLGFNIKDILRNSREAESVKRTLQLEYVKFL
jgi:hypothetical protein